METKNDRYEYFKDKFVDAIVNLVALGITGLIGFGVYQAYMADAKADKLKEEVRQEFVEKHNASVKRESELAADIAALKTVLTEQSKELSALKKMRISPPDITIQQPQRIPDNIFEDAQLKAAGDKMKYIQQYQLDLKK
jgi:hypothetical protein